MRVFILCADEGKYVGRIIGNQMQQRLKGVATIHRGGAAKLAINITKNITYDYVLNMGGVERVVAHSKPLNNFHTVKQTLNKKIGLVKMRLRKLPIPVTMTKIVNVTTKDLPMLGWSNTGKEGPWSCLDLSDVRRSESEGATHWVEFIPLAREFKIHVVAPSTALYLAKQKDFCVLKISERLEMGEGRAKVFGDIINPKDPIIVKLRELGQRTLSELQLHWGVVTILADEVGCLSILKVDACPNIKEDQTNTLMRYSNALCKMLGEKPQPLILSRPKS